MSTGTGVGFKPIRSRTSIASLAIAILALLSTALLYSRGVIVSRGEREPDEVITQAGRLYGLMKDYGSELQNVAGQANYPDDEAKENGKKSVRQFFADLEVARVAHKALLERRDRTSLMQFVYAACGVPPLTGGCMSLQPPSFSKYVSGSYQSGKFEAGKTVNYGNTARLESMHDDFVVLLTEMLKTAN